VSELLALTDQIGAALADRRARVERARRQVELETAELVEMEHAARRVTVLAMRARRARHLKAGETEGPRAPARDGAAAPEPTPPAALAYWTTADPPRHVPERPAARRGLLGLLVLVLALLMPASAQATLTPLSEVAMERALRAGHVEVFGRAPGRERLRVALAQVSLETGRGRVVRCRNLGNITASRRSRRCSTGPGLRRFASARAAAAAYWRLASVRAALPYFDRGDAEGAAYALGRAGYYEASPDAYAAGMRALYDEKRRRRKR
jgi:hypothetical protein